MDARIDLTAPQQDALASVFARYARRVDRVSVYGSRARGRARPGSDVDLVVYGTDDRDIAAIKLALEDSELSIFADVVAYERIRSERLREEIDSTAISLFDPDELRSLAANAG